MSDIAWTPELRRQVHASRTQPNPAYLVERLHQRSLAYPLDAAACRAKIELGWADARERPKALLRTGLANNSPPWHRVVSTLLARAERPTVEIPLEVDVEAASIATHLARVSAAVPYWVARGGVAFAVRALARCAELTTYGKDNRYLDERGDWVVEDRGHSMNQPEDLHEEWPLLRALLAEADAADYDLAREAAVEVLERTPRDEPWKRGMLLWIPFAFPDEPAFAEVGRDTALEISEVLSTHKNRSDGRATLAVARYLSVASIETGLAVLAHRKAVIGFADVLTIIAHRGLEVAMPLIEVALDKLATEADRKTWCKAYFALGVPALVELAARRFPESKAIVAAVARYWRTS